jgi:hypothetical protein
VVVVLVVVVVVVVVDGELEVVVVGVVLVVGVVVVVACGVLVVVGVGVAAVTANEGLDVATAVPFLLFAVTTTRSVEPTSVVPTRYV